ncbi:MAG: HEPN domain-containing protein [Sphingobacteriales bacterium]|nr:MAG: HEPN domain-containing protein [Sphingobacteriales bacterium]
MDKLKDKYEIILGFVTLVISFSAFKDELSKITLPLGYATITASDYLLYIVVGFGFCLYWFIMENVFRETKIGTWKVWNYILKVSYFLFALLLVTPLLLGLNILIFKLINLLDGLNENSKKSLLLILNIISSAVSALAGVMATRYYVISNKYKNRVKAQTEEIIELENAQRLYDQNFYSQSVLESFKVLESHLYNQLTSQEIRVQKHKFNDILKLSLNKGIISDNDLPWINDLRGMRNVAAHSDVAYTKDQAQQALQFVREFLRRSRSENI